MVSNNNYKLRAVGNHANFTTASALVDLTHKYFSISGLLTYDTLFPLVCTRLRMRWNLERHLLLTRLMSEL